MLNSNVSYIHFKGQVVKRRPRNLKLTTIHFPLPAIVSILHRISGIFLFLMIPFLLWTLQESLKSEEQFEVLKQNFNGMAVKFSIWVTLSAILYHLFAGIRHLLLDIHIGETKTGGRKSSILVFMISLFCILGMGYWLWFSPLPQ